MRQGQRSSRPRPSTADIDRGSRSSIPDGLRRCRPVASTSASATRRSRRSCGCTTTSAARSAPSPAPTGSTVIEFGSGGRPEDRHHHHRQELSRRPRRRSTSSASTRSSRRRQLGIRLYKVAMTWPLEPKGIARFADGLDLIIVVEEKRALIETQLKEQLFDTAEPAAVVIGKRKATRAANSEWLFPAKLRRARADRYRDRPGDRRAADGASRIAGVRRITVGGPRLGEIFARPRRNCARPAPKGTACLPAHALFLRRLSAQLLDPWCPMAAAPTPASAAITWRSGWTARPKASPRWAARAPTGSAKRRSPSARTCSRTSVTALISTRARWRSGPRTRPRRLASTSPTSCSTTMPSR